MNLAFWTVAKREIKGLFVSPMAYVVLGLFAFGSGYYFQFSMARFDLLLENAQIQAQLMQNPEVLNYVNLNSFLINNMTSFTFMLLLFLTPLFTMRLLTEEKNQSTYELLMTSPVSVWDITFGKFLAGAVFLLLALLTHGLFLGVMFGFGNPEPGPVLSSYLGLYLSGLSFIAIGLFASAITKHQLIAVVVAVAINLLFLMISWGAENAFGNLSLFLQNASINTHFEQFNQGLIQVSSLVYFLTLMALFLFGTQIAIRSVART